MSVSAEPTEKIEVKRSLWLEVTYATVRRVFELAGGEDVAVVAGSMPRADLALQGHGIAPVQFHFERDGDAVVLVPDASGDLRLDAARVVGPRAIQQRGRIEISGMELEVRVLTDAPSWPDATSPSLSQVGIDYVAALPSEAAQTTAFRPYSATAPIPAEFLATAEIKPIASPIPAEFLATAMIKPAAPREADPVQFGPYGTQVIPIGNFTPEPAFTEKEAAPIAVTKTVAIVPSEPELPREVVTRVSAPPVEAPHVSQAPQVPETVAEVLTHDTTAFEMPRVVPPEGWSSGAATPPSGERPFTARTGRDSGRHEQAAPEEEVETRSPSFSMRVGTLAKQRPGLTAVGTVVSGLVLALALASVSRVLGGRNAPRVVDGAAAASAVAPSRVESTAAPVAVPKDDTSVAPPGLAKPDVVPAAELVPAAPPSTKRGVVADPETLAAVGALVGGRTRDAERAYAVLARRPPTDEAVVVLSRLLTRANDPRCATAAESPASCPEVKR